MSRTHLAFDSTIYKKLFKKIQKDRGLWERDCCCRPTDYPRTRSLSLTKRIAASRNEIEMLLVSWFPWFPWFHRFRSSKVSWVSCMFYWFRGFKGSMVSWVSRFHGFHGFCGFIGFIGLSIGIINLVAARA